MQRWGPLSPACSKHSAPPLCAITVTQLLLNSKSAFLEPAFHLKVPTTNTLEKEMATHSSILAWRIPMDRGAWRATVHGIPELDTTERLTQTHTHTLLTPRTSLVGQTVKNLPAMQETWVRSLGQEDPLEEGMATHSSILV